MVSSSQGNLFSPLRDGADLLISIENNLTTLIEITTLQLLSPLQVESNKCWSDGAVIVKKMVKYQNSN